MSGNCLEAKLKSVFYRSLCLHYWNFLHIQVDHCKWKNFTVADIGRDTLVAQTQQYILHKVTLQKFDASVTDVCFDQGNLLRSIDNKTVRR